MVTVFLADGFEEIEAVTPIDLLRRAEVEVTLCSLNDTPVVTGAHGIVLHCDTTLSQWQGTEKMMLLPGGMPGTLHLKKDSRLRFRLMEHARRGGFIAAICAAPTVLGALGLLKGKRATSYPSTEKELLGAEVLEQAVVVDGNVITSRGAGTAFDFGLKLVELLRGEEVARKLAAATCYGEMPS